MSKKQVAYLVLGPLTALILQVPFYAMAENEGQGILQNVEKRVEKISQRIDDENVPGDRQSVSMKPNGDFFLTGVTVNAVSVGDQTITGSIYNASKTVNVAGASFIGARITIGLGDIQVGDKITARGNYNVATRVIAVTEIHDITLRTSRINDLQRQIEELLKRLKELLTLQKGNL